MAKISHVHRLKRHSYKTGNKVFFCTLPDCNFKIEVALSLGKNNICWRCGKTFPINEYSIRLAKPHCNDCHIRKGDNRANTLARKAVAKSVAADEVNSLRDRLSSVSVVEYSPEDKDDDL